MSEIKNIPKHWKYSKLGEVCKLKNGYAFKSNNYENAGVPVIRISDINDGFVSNVKAVRVKPIAEYENYLVEKNDILVAMSGATTGKFGVYKSTEKAYQNQRVGKFKILDENILNNDFLYLQINSLKRQIEKDAYGGAQPNISSTKIEQMQIVIPPLSEQQAIVAKIEELLSELDNGKKQLQMAQQQLKVYRQSLLKWAFEGKELLPFENFVDTSQNGLSKRTGTNGEAYKVLRLADITNNVIDKSSPRTIVMDKNEIERYKIKTDDLICVRVNGSKDLVGKLVHVSIQNEKDNWAFCDHFIRFRLHPQKAYSKYFHFYFSTVKMRKYIHDNMVTSAGQNTVSQGTIKNAPVPNCSIKEQQLIVDELESKLTICDKIEETISQSLQQAETLRQSILKKAFEGKLVKMESHQSNLKEKAHL